MSDPAAPAPFLDLADPAFDVTSPQVHRTRDQQWYAETSYGHAVLRYAEASALLTDRRFRQGNARWPEQNGVHEGPFLRWWQEVLLSLEGADHARLRRLLMPAFRRKAIEAMQPEFQRIATELLDAFADRGEVELIAEFAEPYSARILCLLLGLPEEEWQQVAHWADDLGKSFGIRVKEDLPRIEAALAGLTEYVERVVDDRAAHPRDDLVTTLLQAQESDGRLTRDELIVSLVFLAFAGMETTRNQVGLAIQTFLRHPDQWRLLAERPELGSAAVEEVMRVNPTVTWVTREAVEDVDLHGLHLPAGSIVQVLSHAAGTDPSAVEEPGFDITRAAGRPPHLGFGGGVHHCLGHFVARTDMAVALPLLAQRMPEAVADGPGEWLPVSGNTGALRFPIRFRAGAPIRPVVGDEPTP
ncbi:cytochrome P450 [Nocardioides sambongensis]|uniref:cytochrome P450 n=1 Tax=Nocardioides sambongensis TaxID=2589074 RepID=UPI001E363287|nr:cytochrome P450 [Nocardioides sambongensis]